MAESVPGVDVTAGPKKKNNKKKKKTSTKINGAVADGQDGPTNDLNTTDDVAEAMESGKVEPPKNDDPSPAEMSLQNGHVTPSDEAAEEAAEAPNTTIEETSQMSMDSTSARLEAMTQERQALKLEVEQMRRSLQDLRTKHDQELVAIKSQHAEDLSKAQTASTAADTASPEVDQLKTEVATIKAELEESEAAKAAAETQYQTLLGRVNTIKASLGERLKADKQDLEEARGKIEELEKENMALRDEKQGSASQLSRLQKEAHDTSRELSSLRNRHTLSQQNWVNERQDLVLELKQLKEEAEAAKEAMGDWEVLAMEERSIREGLEAKIRDLDDQFTSQREAYEMVTSERDSHAQAVTGMQRALQNLQDTRKQELREMVESSEQQVLALKKLVEESDAKANKASTTLDALKAEVDRLTPFEKEVKEKNLLIGKLRHEAIVLNDHLTKALRFLKKAKPEDNIDRQIVTNHFLHFLALDRSDPKKFQILQIIAALLNWTDEQREQAGLARPGTAGAGAGAGSGGSLRLPSSPFARASSTSSLSTEYLNETGAGAPGRESLADLWTGFLERSAEEGTPLAGNSRSGSVSSLAVSSSRPVTRDGGMREPPGARE